MSKVQRRSGPSVFADLDDNPTAAEVADSIFGKSSPIKTIRAKPIDILKIKPDSLQPRRAVPSELRAVWKGDPKRTEILFEEWLDAIKEERGGSELIFKDILESKGTRRGEQAETDSDGPEQSIGSFEATFIKLVELAASIKRDGLTNPITVAPDEDGYIIETGERRWLAFHLLKMVYGDELWGEIPAREVKEVSIWRQASENNARDDLNAISTARQLSLLLMALHGWENFKPIEDFEHEIYFYAQVADGHKWRIPRGFGEQLLNAMSISSASHLRRYRAILRVEKSLWDAADDNDWTERDIRDKVNLADDLAENRDRGHDTQQNSTPLPEDEYLEERKLQAKILTDVAKISQKALMGELSNHQRADALAKINILRQWLIQQEKLIKGN